MFSPAGLTVILYSLFRTFTDRLDIALLYFREGKLLEKFREIYKMDQDEDIAVAGLFMFTIALAVINRRKRDARGQRVSNRRWWTHPINMARDGEGAWTLLMDRFRTEFPEKHQNCLRMTKENFDNILELIRPAIEKQDTHFRKCIPSDQRLCVTLFYLATGDSFKTLALFFRMGESTIRAIVYQTCQAIWDILSPLHLSTPTRENEWEKIARGFEHQWNFPNCLGAIDGKHCYIQSPANSGSEYFNYKGTFSIVLLGICDSLYKFVYIDVGTPGRWSDGGTFDQCTLNDALKDGGLKIFQV